jgi:release factor H-coupled RctB family protein
MLFVETNLNKNKAKPEKWIKKLYLDDEWTGGDVSEFLKKRKIEETSFDKHSLGTIGSGNHFAELQEIHSIEDEEEAKKLKLDINQLYLLIHSGN